METPAPDTEPIATDSATSTPAPISTATEPATEQPQERRARVQQEIVELGGGETEDEEEDEKKDENAPSNDPNEIELTPDLEVSETQ
jgi:hypothetical protein